MVSEMAVWPGEMGHFFIHSMHRNKKNKPAQNVPGSVHRVGVNTVKQSKIQSFFRNCFPPDGNTSVILNQGNPVSSAAVAVKMTGHFAYTFILLEVLFHFITEWPFTNNRSSAG